MHTYTRAAAHIAVSNIAKTCNVAMARIEAIPGCSC